MLLGMPPGHPAVGTEAAVEKKCRWMSFMVRAKRAKEPTRVAFLVRRKWRSMTYTNSNAATKMLAAQWGAPRHLAQRNA